MRRARFEDKTLEIEKHNPRLELVGQAAFALSRGLPRPAALLQSLTHVFPELRLDGHYLYVGTGEGAYARQFATAGDWLYFEPEASRREVARHVLIGSFSAESPAEYLRRRPEVDGVVALEGLDDVDAARLALKPDGFVLYSSSRESLAAARRRLEQAGLEIEKQVRFGGPFTLLAQALLGGLARLPEAEDALRRRISVFRALAAVSRGLRFLDALFPVPRAGYLLLARAPR